MLNKLFHNKRPRNLNNSSSVVIFIDSGGETLSLTKIASRTRNETADEEGHFGFFFQMKIKTDPSLTVLHQRKVREIQSSIGTSSVRQHKIRHQPHRAKRESYTRRRMNTYTMQIVYKIKEFAKVEKIWEQALRAQFSELSRFLGQYELYVYNTLDVSKW